MMRSDPMVAARYNASMASDKPSSRREFLRGRSAARALLDAARNFAGAAAASFADADQPSASALQTHRPSTAHAHLHTSRRAMACEFAIQHHAADGADAAEAVLAALDLVEALED